ncbi:hypothetical protein BPORC_1753 [Bifidobacterium porcinum]|nr:hypothetical protein BPORC_1753 [Bifidobacterium porcinum]
MTQYNGCLIKLRHSAKSLGQITRPYYPGVSFCSVTQQHRPIAPLDATSRHVNNH